MPTTNALTTGVVTRGWYGDSDRYNFEVAIPITSSTQAYASVPFVLPPRCQVIWASLANGSTMTYNGTDATNTANAAALVAYTAATNATQPTTGSTSASSALILRGSTSTSANSVVFAGTALNAAAAVNTTSSDQYLFLMPVFSGTAYAQYFHTGTSTGYKFASTGNLNLKVFIQKFNDVATNTAS